MRTQQKSNLEKLADYLESGKLKAEFDMGKYADNGDIGVTNCGSCGCPIGHGPYAGIPKLHNERWKEYAERVFGVEGYTGVYNRIFHSNWAAKDNTPEGAAARIRAELEKL